MSIGIREWYLMRMVLPDCRTGNSITTFRFGQNGLVELKRDDDQKLDPLALDFEPPWQEDAILRRYYGKTGQEVGAGLTTAELVAFRLPE